MQYKIANWENIYWCLFSNSISMLQSTFKGKKKVVKQHQRIKFVWLTNTNKKLKKSFWSSHMYLEEKY